MSERLHSTKAVKVKDKRQCYGCWKFFKKGTVMLAQKYFPSFGNSDPYRGLVAPKTIHVCEECLILDEQKSLIWNYKK